MVRTVSTAVRRACRGIAGAEIDSREDLAKTRPAVEWRHSTLECPPCQCITERVFLFLVSTFSQLRYFSRLYLINSHPS